MQLCSIHDEIQGSPGQFSFHHFQCSDVNGGLVLAVSAVKVWRCMFIPEHLDDDSKKLTDSWHVAYRAFAALRLKRYLRFTGLTICMVILRLNVGILV